MNWIKLNRTRSNSAEYAVITDVFGLEGNLYPRLVISIYSSNTIITGEWSSFTISCSQKDSPKSWWSQTEIPNQLLPNLIELLEDYQYFLQEFSND